MKYNSFPGYKIVECKELDDLRSEGYVLRHVKTGAKVALISNDDDNKVFYIGFRTPPVDSTGSAHIVEHTVLCGSDKYPLKDPFVELVKSSLNTFLNAMTYPDKTVYPVASCNDKDFKNLMDVYLDAVFHPNIYKNKMIFEQEGWHYEMEDENSDLIVNGVVYNEMKGVYSSAEDMIDFYIRNNLYDGSPYALESGGDPDCIPDLTYEDFLNFHSRYYHPSNSYIYLYGDMDMAERLEYLDKEYLSKYDYLELDSSINHSYEKVKEANVRIEYPIAEEEDEKDNTFFTYNVALDNNSDKKEYLAIGILADVICNKPGSPIKTKLVEEGIVADVACSYENGIKEPYISFIGYNGNEEDADKFTKIIEDTLSELVKSGLNHKTVLSNLCNYEFKYREADYGRYPKGLIVGLQALDSWLYEDTDPFKHIIQSQTISELKESIEDGYWEQLIEKYILKNDKKVILTAVPKKGMVQAKEKELSDKLARYKESLSADEIKEIVKHTKELKAFQDAEEDPENLKCLPTLGIEDIKKEAAPIYNDVEIKDGIQIVSHDIFTNKIVYLQYLFNISDISEEQIKYLNLFSMCLKKMNTYSHSYSYIYDEIDLHTGGISFIPFIVRNYKKDTYEIFMMAKTKVLPEELDNALAIMKEIIKETDFNNPVRLKEIISEEHSKIKSSMASQGHTVSAGRASASIDEVTAIKDRIDGLQYTDFIADLDESWEAQSPAVINALETLRKFIFTKDIWGIDITYPKNEEINNKALSFKDDLYEPRVRGEKIKVDLLSKNLALKTSGQVQYVTLAGKFDKDKYRGYFKLLKVILGYDYLWINVRVKGGAYGVFPSFGMSGIVTMTSYRDPKLSETIGVFESVGDYLAAFKADKEQMTKHIIGTMSSEDMPLTPMTKGNRSMLMFLQGTTYEELQKERDEIIGATDEDIRKVAEILDEVYASKSVCVVGSESAIENNKDIFDEVRLLLK